MTAMTTLDQAYQAMQTGDEAARLRFYEVLAATDLVLLLETEPKDDQIAPVTVEVEGQTYLLAFDEEARLAAFAKGPAPYAGLPGRALVEMLAGQGVGLGLNFDADETGALVPADAVDWLMGILSERPEEASAKPTAFAPPLGVPDALIDALEARLASAAGLAQAAYLTQASYDDGTAGILLGIVGVAHTAEASLAQAVTETLAFSGFEEGSVDVAFLSPEAGVLPALVRQGREIPIPAPKQPAPGPKPPGSDGPPKLR